MSLKSMVTAMHNVLVPDPSKYNKPTGEKIQTSYVWTNNTFDTSTLTGRYVIGVIFGTADNANAVWSPTPDHVETGFRGNVAFYYSCPDQVTLSNCKTDGGTNSQVTFIALDVNTLS